MTLNYTYINNEQNETRLYLCKPNIEHNVIGNLVDVYNININYELGAISEMTFEAPVLIERNHELIENPFVKRFDGYYHVKVVQNGKIEYFVYTTGNKLFSNDGHTVQYKLYSTAYLLNFRKERGYEEVSKPLSYHVREILGKTDWSLDFCDVYFDTLYRTYEVSENTVLQCMFELAELYGAMIIFDTVNRKINFHKEENIGINKGFEAREGVFLESYNLEYNFDQIITRLNVYGQDGLEFRRFSPTGSNYIESLDWFIYPFEADEQWNVIRSSNFLDDDLCIAIRKYEKKVKDSEGLFGNLVGQRTIKEDERIQKEQELSNLVAERNQIENERWTINKTLQEMLGENETSRIKDGVDKYPPEVINQYEANRQDAVSRLNAKEVQIAEKNAEIDGIKAELTSIEAQITALRVDLQVENNYTLRQLEEMSKWIYEESYTNDSISDEEDLLADGLSQFKKVNQPPIKLQLTLANFLRDFRFDKIKDRIVLGDRIKLKSNYLDIYIEAKIVKISVDADNNSFVLTVANEKDLHDKYSILEGQIYTAANTSTTVNIDKSKWNKGDEALTLVDEILNSEFDAAKNAVTAGYMDLTTLDRFGLKSMEYNNSDTFLFINNGILGITSNNLNTVEVAISKNGVHAKRLVGEMVLSNQVMIMDTLGIIDIKDGLQTIYDNTGKERVYLGRYPSPDNSSVFKYGLRIVDGAIDIRTSSTSNSGMQIDGSGIRAFNNNGVKTFSVDALSGQVEIIGGIKIKTSPDTNRGTEIDGNGFRIYGNGGQLVFNADHFGNIYYAGRLQSATGTVSNLGGSVQNMTGSVTNLTGDINGVTGTFAGLVTGSLSAQTISAVTIDVDQLRANNAHIDNLSAISSDLGTITAGTIDIDTDLRVGNRIYVGKTSDWNTEKSIIFSGSASVTYDSDVISMSAIEEVKFEATRVNIIASGGLWVNGTRID